MAEEKREPFTQLPNHILEYLMIAKLNMTQSRIFAAVARYTYGFHNEWRQLSLSFLADQINCDRSQSNRELQKLLKTGVLLERNYNGKRELQINPLLSGDLSAPSVDANKSPVDGYSSVPHIKKVFKEKEDKEKLYLLLDIEGNKHIKVYNHHFKKRYGKDHMAVSEENLVFIEDRVESIRRNSDFEDWEDKVEEHFNNLPKGNNGNILPFLHASYRFFNVNKFN